jgi:LacI family transcriptional regulator
MTSQRIGIIAHLNWHYFRCVLRGIHRYAATKPGWVLVPTLATPEQISGLKRGKPDGVIAQVHDSSLVPRLRRLGCPMINVSRVKRGIPFPHVGVDEVETGEQAAVHLIERGLKHFASIGQVAENFFTQRVEGFRRVIERQGYDVQVLDVPREMFRLTQSKPWLTDQRVKRWLTRLSRPVGLFIGNDFAASQCLEVCRAVGLRVPEDVALVGVDNDELLCEFARPSLSSVALPADDVGYAAAALLDQMMQGVAPPDEPVRLPPLGVVARQSSDILTIDDPEVAEALRYIQTHSHVAFHIEDMLRELPVTRRTLERHFRRVLNRSIADEIRRVHIELAKRLLLETRLSIAEVAQHAGFSDPKQLYAAFRQQLGCTPMRYRSGRDMS